MRPNGVRLSELLLLFDTRERDRRPRALCFSQVESRGATATSCLQRLSYRGFCFDDSGRAMIPVGVLSMSPGTITASCCYFWFAGGALGSSPSTWIRQRNQDRRNLLAKKIFYREQLYSYFISESARILVDALEHNFSVLPPVKPRFGPVLGGFPFNRSVLFDHSQ